MATILAICALFEPKITNICIISHYFMLRHRVQGDGMVTCESLEAVEAAAPDDAHLDWSGARHGDR